MKTGATPPARRYLALRFDIDSVTCLEQGVPALMRLADRRGIRFTFFVNMGRSFSWRYTVGRILRRRSPMAASPDSCSPRKLSAATKLGRAGMVRTMILNPRLGHRYRATLDLLHREGHELGLHGGTDHAAWQYGLDRLGDEGLERLFRPAFADFRDRYGHPRGFASPGFRYNDAVLDLLDREGFEYASDMVGERPFRPLRSERTTRHAAYQVPVNVVGEHRVPLVEQGLARGDSHERIVERACERIRERPFALMYGHPYVEGVHWQLLDAVLREIATSHQVATVAEYLTRWKETAGDG